MSGALPSLDGRPRLLDEMAIARAVMRLAHEIAERHDGEATVLAGIRTRGVPLAARVGRALAALGQPAPDLAALELRGLPRRPAPARAATARRAHRARWRRPARHRRPRRGPRRRRPLHRAHPARRARRAHGRGPPAHGRDAGARRSRPPRAAHARHVRRQERPHRAAASAWRCGCARSTASTAPGWWARAPHELHPARRPRHRPRDGRRPTRAGRVAERGPDHRDVPQDRRGHGPGRRPDPRPGAVALHPGARPSSTSTRTCASPVTRPPRRCVSGARAAAAGGFTRIAGDGQHRPADRHPAAGRGGVRAGRGRAHRGHGGGRGHPRARRGGARRRARLRRAPARWPSATTGATPPPPRLLAELLRRAADVSRRRCSSTPRTRR